MFKAVENVENFNPKRTKASHATQATNKRISLYVIIF